jgi:hypothetical protein
MFPKPNLLSNMYKGINLLSFRFTTSPRWGTVPRCFKAAQYAGTVPQRFKAVKVLS